MFRPAIRRKAAEGTAALANQRIADNLGTLGYRTLITADAGGSNGYRTRGWKTPPPASQPRLALRSRCATYLPGSASGDSVWLRRVLLGQVGVRGVCFHGGIDALDVGLPAASASVGGAWCVGCCAACGARPCADGVLAWG